MRIAGINKNDFAAAPGVSVTVYVQGCPHCCEGCHNPETWNFEDGQIYTPELSNEIIKALNDNRIFRSLCIQGGEPLAPQNLDGVMDLIYKTKLYSPFTRIYIWTGYIYEDLVQSAESDPTLKYILNTIDFLIDGPYIERLRDITLKMRGSSNQRIIDLTKK